MRENAYKGILDFLIQVHGGQVQGNPLRRLQQITAMVLSCMRAKRCTVEALSQPCQGSAPKKKDSLIQQSKRSLKNKWVDWDLFFLPFAKHFLHRAALSGELTVIIDGSQLGSNHTCLMVSVLWKKSAIPITWLVKEGEKGHFPELLHIEVLSILLLCVPTDCRVVLLGDGEFDGKDLRAFCEKNCWEYVLRTACDKQVDCGVETTRIDKLSPPKGHTSLFIPNATESSNAVVWHDQKFERPIYLLTNLDVGIIACRYYKKRFKIESMFKILKSKGFQLHKTRLEDAETINRLVMIAAFAFCFTFCLGLYLKKSGNIAFLEQIVRKCKLKTMGAIYLAQQCLEQSEETALQFFSNISMSFDEIFT